MSRTTLANTTPAIVTHAYYVPTTTASLSTTTYWSEDSELTTFAPSNETTTENFETYYYHRFIAEVIVWGHVSMVIFVFGMIGNTLSIVVLNSKHIGVFPASTYLNVLAVSDNILLIAGLLNTYLYMNYNIVINATSSFACKVMHVAWYASKLISVWMIVTMTIERTICVLFPLKARNIRRKHRLIAASAVVSVWVIFNLHWAYGVQLEGAAPYRCLPKGATYRYFIYGVLSIMDLVIFSVGPSIILIVCNVAIVMRHQRSKEQLNVTTEGTKEAGARLVRITVLLGVTFVVTTIPYTCVSLMMAWTKIYINWTLPFYLTLALVYVNNSVNFILYAASGPRFRNALIAVLTCQN